MVRPLHGIVTFVARRRWHCRWLSSSPSAVREDDALADALCELEAPRTLARIMDLHPNSRGTVDTSQLVHP